MMTTLDCTCGARMETDARPGRTVVCPECDRRLTVAAPGQAAVRTSGLALASVIVGLVGLFTVVLTALAILLGLAALFTIARRRDELAGTGYAILGIVLGMVFTPLSLFAYSQAEVFVGLREKLRSPNVDQSGPLLVSRPKEGYTITRPTGRWGIARGDLAQELAIHKDSLVLACPSRHGYLEVSVQNWRPRITLEECRQEVMNWFRPQYEARRGQPAANVVQKTSRQLPDQEGLEVLEVQFEVRLPDEVWMQLARILKRRDTGRVYVVRGWAPGRRFTQVEREIRQAQDSFQLLQP